MKLRVIGMLNVLMFTQSYHIRTLSVIPGHRGVNIEIQDVNSVLTADSIGTNLAKNPLNVVHLLDTTGKIIKIYSK